MAFVKRFGGWRPVQMEKGKGVVRLAGGSSIDAVEYRFEVWHQMVDGFPGPFRAEGVVNLPPEERLDRVVGREVILVLEDGRFLPLRVSADGTLLAHTRPSSSDPAEAKG